MANSISDLVSGVMSGFTPGAASGFTPKASSGLPPGFDQWAAMNKIDLNGVDSWTLNNLVTRYNNERSGAVSEPNPFILPGAP